MTGASGPAIELSVLAAPTDLGFLGPTLRHQLRVFERCSFVSHRALVVDLRDDTDPAARRQLEGLAKELIGDGLLDEMRPVDWRPQSVSSSLQHWYGTPDASPFAGRQGRAARYQFMYSVDSATEQWVLHLDSDVLLHMSRFAWIAAARDLLAADPQVVAVVPYGEVPQATRLAEWVLGRRADRPNYPPGWQLSTDFTSRACMIDRDRFAAKVLPLPTRDAVRHWEADIAVALQDRGCKKATFVDEDEYFLHPHRHNDNHVTHVDDLVALVEAGDYPYRRVGHPWDITTEGRRFLPWWTRIQMMRLRRRIRGRRSPDRRD